MKIREIIKDAIIYPLSDWKKIVILGIILEISSIAGFALIYTTNIYVLSILIGVGFLVGFLVNGYLFKILKSSLNGASELPGFNTWDVILIDGANVFIVFFIYLILPILVVVLFLLLLGGNPFLGSFYATDLASTGISPISIFVDDVTSVVSDGILSYPNLFYTFMSSLLLFIYIIILIIPVFLVALGNMAYNKGEFRAAFDFREILDDIICIGRINLIKWYIVTGIIFLWVFGALIIATNYIFSLIHLNDVFGINLGGIILSLTIFPYSYMFTARSLALFYKPED